jgi:lysophospholipase L1-like esterase
LFVAPVPMVWEDPYVSFSGLRPLFVLDSTGAHYEVAEERFPFFCTQSFAAVKEADTFRIFCLGGSTVQGRPYAIETSFTSWLDLNLDAAGSRRDYEVVNCGGISYASYRLVPMMRELLGYEPDLFIIYTGHNEFLEDRSYGRIKKMPREVIRLHRTLLKLRSYSLAHRYLSGRCGRDGDSAKTELPGEVQAKLDYEEGLTWYHRDEAWREGTIEHFQHNLETLVQMSREARVPVILMNPVSNLKDSPPFKSEYSSGLTETERQRVEELREKARQLAWNDSYGKLRYLEQAVEIDNRHAGILYLTGKCYEQGGRIAEAKSWFVRAKEEDVCPLRILEAMHEIILEVVEENSVPLVDVKFMFEEHSEAGVPGDEWLLDHVHPNIQGHQLIADTLYQTIEEMELVTTPEDWQSRRDKLWQDHQDSLSPAYYARGNQQLERLRKWCRGEVPDIPK